MMDESKKRMNAAIDEVFRVIRPAMEAVFMQGHTAGMEFTMSAVRSATAVGVPALPSSGDTGEPK